MESTGEFDARLEPLPDGGAVVRVRGDVDLATTPLLEEAMLGVGDADPVVVDLRECSLVDSSGLRLLTSAAREAQAAGRRIALVVTDPGIRRVLEITSVDTALPVHSTLEEAL